MKKDVTLGADLRALMVEGVCELADAVALTLGPRGRYALVRQEGKPPLATNDGVTVATSIELADPVEQMGVELMREVAKLTNDKAGDGTTTATVLARSLITDATRAVEAGADPLALRSGIQRAAGLADAALRRLSLPVETHEELVHVATISAKEDALGELVAEAVDRVGARGTITLEPSKTAESRLEVRAGMQFERGLRSPYFATSETGFECDLDEPLILLTDIELRLADQVLPALQMACEADRPLLIIAEKLEGEAFATVVENVLRGTVRAAAVDPPAYANGRRRYLEDLAVFTGGTFLSHELFGYTTDDLTPQMLGSADHVHISPKFTVIEGGHGDPEAIELRRHQLAQLIEANKYDFDKKQMTERRSRLGSGTATLFLGASSDSEYEERKLRAEDAVNAAKAAAEEGVLPGGGAAYVEAVRAVRKFAESLEGDERHGALMLCTALLEPARIIAQNAGANGRVVVAELEARPRGCVFDVTTLTYVDAVGAGIVDSTRVCRLALQCAVSVASTTLVTEGGVAAGTEQRSIRELMGV